VNGSGCDRFWAVDPMPVPPAPFGTMQYWRWKSAETLDPDYCSVCGRHYTEPCEDGCDCESCQRMEQERDRLIEIEMLVD
jgi:hypothetical protein